MKNCFLAAILFMMMPICLSAQSSEKEYFERYALLVNRFGADGVGVETLINKWVNDFPEDVNAYVARFNYYVAKSRSSQVVPKGVAKYLGSAPVVVMKDSLGNDVRYFEEPMYNDSLFTLATSAIDKAISLSEYKLENRFCKLTALEAYEKDDPGMTTLTLNSLIDLYYSVNAIWTYNDQPVDGEFFKSAVQEYCYSFYLLGSAASYEAFRNVSEHMLSIDKNDPLFLSNLGSYYLVCKKDNRQASKYYAKVLKVDPNNYTAIKNLVLMARKDNDVKSEKKYLPMLIRTTSDQAEKMSAEARLKTL